MKKHWILVALLTFALARAVNGQPAPEEGNPDEALGRGLKPNRVFALNGIDTVNLYNGNLTLSVPIGQEYRVAGDLSYQFQLVHNSKMWEILETPVEEEPGDPGPGPTEPEYYRHPEPNPASNAGLGWTLTLGMLFSPGTLPADFPTYPGWTYVDPSGARHRFEASFRGIADGNPDVYYNDDLNARLRRISASVMEIDFPDGTIHRFLEQGSSSTPLCEYEDPYDPTLSFETLSYPDPWRLSSIEDRFGNRVTISYDPARLDPLDQVEKPAWTVSDTAGRSHIVWFREWDLSNHDCKLDKPQVERLELAAFGGGSATYSFEYYLPSLPLCHKNTWPRFYKPRTQNMIFKAAVPVLSRVLLPEGFKYVLQTNQPAGSTPGCPDGMPGQVDQVRLPTGGKLEWDYGTWSLPGRRLAGWDTGVVKRRTLALGGAVEGEWTYSNWKVQPIPTNPDLFGTRTQLLSPDGCSEHAFEDTGLPFSEETALKSGDYFFSSEVYPAGSSCGGTPLRSEYVRYDSGVLSRQLRGRRTVYHDDLLSGGDERFADTLSSDFDGLGHYRTTITDGNFASGNVRETFTDYNPDRGTLDPADLSTYTMIHPDDPWVTHAFAERTVSEAGATARETFCFSPDNGFLERHRVHLGSGESAHDIVVEYLESDPPGNDGLGNVERERHFGGDLQTLPESSDLCGIGLGSPAYEVDHSYSHGSLSRSAALDASGNEVLVLVDHTIDSNTGLPEKSRGPAGAETTWVYSDLGILSQNTLADGAVVNYELQFLGGNGTGANAWMVVPPVTWWAVERSENTLDGFARVRVERDYRKSRMRHRKYDPSGRLSQISEWDHGANWTTFEYDALDRVVRVTPPDGTTHDVVTEYVGEAIVRRTANVAGTAGEFPATTEEEYDRQGRLVRVTEPSGEDGASTSTVYGYDIGGRLASVSTQASVAGSQVTQERLFNYDHLGFLRSERYPEKGAAGNGLVIYDDYNARGLAGRKTDGPSDLALTYDRAGRLTEVSEAGTGGRPLKSFEFALANDPQTPANLRKGKLVRATRHNYRPAPFDDDLTVSESFAYESAGGKVTRRTTELDAIPWFDQTWSWLPTGRLGRVGYPTCLTPACQGAPTRDLLQNYSMGNLNKVCETANGATCTSVSYTFTFHPNGMLRQTRFPYPSAVKTETYMDLNSMQRPRWMWSYQGSTVLYNSGEFSYDGAGNVATMGNDVFAYDGVSRLISGTTMQGTFAQSNVYDPFGNRVSLNTDGAVHSIPTDPTTNRLLDQPEGPVTYDPAGNVTQWGPATYTYDALNMPIQQTGVAGRTYVYTADDERLATYVNGGAQSSTWTVRGLDGKVLRVVSEDGAGSWTWEKDYVYREGSLLASESADHGTWNYHLDHLGTVRMITAAVPGVDAIVSRHDYYAFGEEAMPTHDGETLRFTGHERDEVSYPADPGALDLDYMHARYYSPHMGRFLSVDPVESGKVGMPQSWNKYAYGLNNPLKYVDPDGRAVETAWDAANVAIGAGSLIANISSGNVVGAIVDVGGLALDLGATAVPFVPGGASTGIRAVRAARLARNARFGKAFEKAVLNALDLSKNTGRVTKGVTGAKFRVPDAFAEGILLEVKGVKKLSLTAQVRDFLGAAAVEGQKVVIAVTKDTKVSRKFDELIESGDVVIVRFAVE